MLRSPVLIALAAVQLLAGCTYQILAYAPDPSSSNALKGASSKVKVVALPPAFADEGSILCRGAGPVALPTGQTFTQYIADALRMELAAARAFDPAGGEELRMMLKRVDFQTTLGATNWYIDADYEMRSGRFTVSTVHNERSSYMGDKACANMGVYFRAAVARHIRETFSYPALREQLAVPPR